MLKTRDHTFKGKTVVVSGSGNVAQYTVEKVNELGGKVVTLSDSSGTIYDPDGIDKEKLAFVMELKNIKRGRIKEYSDKYGCDYKANEKPWTIKCDCAFPSATQNEIDGNDAKTLIDNGCYLISEGANMPSTPEAIELYVRKKILSGPGKAANAGGVATSGLEMSQNSQRFAWTREEVDQKLKSIMSAIHQQCVETAEEYGQPGNYVMGANIAGFVKVADSMLDQGLI